MLHEPQVDLGSTAAADEAVATEVIHTYIHIYTCEYVYGSVICSNDGYMPVADTGQQCIHVSDG